MGARAVLRVVLSIMNGGSTVVSVVRISYGEEWKKRLVSEEGL